MQGAHQIVVKGYTLKFMVESRDLPVYELTVAKRGAKLEKSTATDRQPLLVNKVFPTHIELPARNATMAQFASMLQRAVLDRPVVDKTGLTGTYDFNLEWTPDDTQFDGRLPASLTTSGEKPDLFAALDAQVGLKLESSRGSVDIIVIDSVDRPTV